MFKTFLKTFDSLPISNKSMIYLMWIYSTWFIISSIFINIYVFKLYSSITDVIIFNIISYTSIIVWFVVFGFLMSVWGKNIKNMYYVWYVLFILSFLSLFFLEWNIIWVYIFSFIFWLGDWAFWNAVHTQELKHIEDKNRDFFSSSISAWDNIIKIVLPLIISWIFFVGKVWEFDAYILVFLFLPLIFMISFLFIRNIEDYIPKKISFDDIKLFFNLKKHKYWHLYFLTSWINEALIVILIPILSIYFLKNEINVWLFQSFLTFVSISLIVHFSWKRHNWNRFKYLFIIVILMSLNYLFLWIFLWTISFIVFSLIILFLEPILWVSYHVYNLYLMDSMETCDNDFYPSMMWREVLLWIWRIWILSLFALIISLFSFDLETTLRTWILLCVVSYFLLVLFIYLWEKFEK